MPKGVKNITAQRKQAHLDFIEASKARTSVTETTAYMFKNGELVGTAKIDMGPYADLEDPKEAVYRALSDQSILVMGYDVFVPLPNHYLNKPLHIRPLV